MTTLKEIDTSIRKITNKRIDSRPFLCEGDPIGAKVFVAGINPGSPTPFWPFWSQKRGCDKKAWLKEFDQYEGGEKTRRAIEYFLFFLNPIKYIETNLYHICSKRENLLSSIDKDSTLFEYLLNVMEPRFIVLHGRNPRKKIETLVKKELPYHIFVKCTLFQKKVTIIACKHFSIESYGFLQNLGLCIRHKCRNKTKKYDRYLKRDKSMTITDKQFLNYLIKNEDKEIFSTDRGACYLYRLLSASNPISRLSFDIEFYSDFWEKDHLCPPETTMNFLDDYNSGKKNRSDYKNKTGKQSLSRRGGYLLPFFKKVEESLSEA